MENKELILTAQSPAGLAEEYLVKSIWQNHFPPGSDLPAERELAEKIGVTRATLREVLQRLARDGWLTIQHGKATKVNDIWQTAGPNILGTLISLSPSLLPKIIDNVVTLRTQMGAYYIPQAIAHNSQATLVLFDKLNEIENSAEAYSQFDYELYRGFTFFADNPVYGLIFNSFKKLYLQVAAYFFNDEHSRQITFKLYQDLYACCQSGDANRASKILNENSKHNAELWKQMLKQLPKSAEIEL